MLGSKFCQERIYPCSTFKVPLALMAIDQGLIKNEGTVFVWDGKDKGREAWNHHQTSMSWMRESVVWVSQEPTPRLGLKVVEAYLAGFRYKTGSRGG